jgi:hypothetical protein
VPLPTMTPVTRIGGGITEPAVKLYVSVHVSFSSRNLAWHYRSWLVRESLLTESGPGCHAGHTKRQRQRCAVNNAPFMQCIFVERLGANQGFVVGPNCPSLQQYCFFRRLMA